MGKKFTTGSMAADILDREDAETRQRPAAKAAGRNDAKQGNKQGKDAVKHKIDNPAVEVKTRRVQLVFRPSTYQKAEQTAQSKGISLNEYLHQLIEGDR